MVRTLATRSLLAALVASTSTLAAANESVVAAQELKLVGADTGSTDQFGASIALDRRTLLASAGGADAAYVFVDEGEGWVQDAKLEPDEFDEFFGWPVSLSGDTAAIGGFTTKGETVFLFQRDTEGWQLEEKVDLSAPGSAFIPGSFSVGTGTLMTTSVFPIGVRVYVRNGDQWNPSNDLEFSEDLDGASLRVLVTDGVALVSAITWGGAGGSDGRVFVFERDGDDWLETAVLRSSVASDGFGDSAMSVSGDVIVVGADDYDLGELANAGTAYVFQRANDQWELTQQLVSPAPGSVYRFGNSIDTTGDALLIGEPGSDEWGNYEGCTPAVCELGAAHLYTRENGLFVLSDTLVASDPLAGDHVGDDVALTDTTAVVSSGSIDFDGLGDTGGAYLFELTQPFSSNESEVSLATGGVVHFDLVAGSTQPDELFLILGSATGTSPGIPWGDVVLPLNWDPYLQYTLTHSLHGNWFYAYGNLSEQGTSSAFLFVPAGLDASLAGLTLHHAFVVLDDLLLTPTFVSNAVATHLTL